MSNQKEQAKKDLLSLINLCIYTGGIFNNAATVAVYVNSVHVLCADENPAMGSGEMIALRNGAQHEKSNQ